MTLYDIFAHGTNPLQSLFIGQQLAELIGYTDTEKLYLRLINESDESFNQWVTSLIKTKYLDPEYFPVFTSLYLLCKAQAEFEFFAGSVASLSDAQTLDDLQYIMELSNHVTNDPDHIATMLENRKPIRMTAPLSARMDLIVMRMHHKKNQRAPTPRQQQWLDVLKDEASQWYKGSQNPDLRDSNIMLALEYIARETSVRFTLDIIDIKTSLLPRLPEEPEPQYVNQLRYYTRVFLKTIIGFRNTFIPTTHQQDEYGHRNRFSASDLATDPIVSMLGKASLLQFYAPIS